MYQKERLYETNYFINKFSGSAEASQVKDGVALFDQVLYTLRKAGTPVDYKAVLTEHNQNWNCMQLYKELEKEHNMYHPS